MRRLRFWLNMLAAAALVGVAAAGPGPARAGDTPSIMKDEPAPPQRKQSVRRGSSSPSPVPPYRSTVTPLGVAPQTVEPYPVDRPGSPARPVPGISGTVGGAVTPPRPAGQSFPDRARDCIHSGMSQGVGAGQIGAYTQSCVNQ